MAEGQPALRGSVSHYRILEKIGEGGMGVIYKAEDVRLERIVALKIVREFQTDAARRRLWQEARATAQVAHPNACRIYDVIEEGEQLVLVMEFIEGESLAARLERGPLPAQEAAQIVLAILSALEAFHKKDIVHRDLKPENIVLSNGGTKLLDFGIAKYASAGARIESNATQMDTTLPGIFLGTPKYASPEQFRGLPVDGRADLFSLGVVFFEMLTGQTPFPGTSFAEISHAVLHGSLPALSGSPAIAAMGRIAHRALAREPQDRYANAAAMAAEVRATLLMEGIETKVRAHPLRRLIVLPFRLLRPDPETQFLAYSLPEAITISLAGLENLVVRSSIVASRYSAEAADLQAIAREAEVDIVLTGALLTIGEQLRITTQLAEAPSGTLLWSHTSQATTRELLELHDDLVKRVVTSILPSLTPREQESLQQDRSASPTAYQFYLQANELSRNWENLPVAAELYERCLKVDPSYAPAWARLGRARWLWDKYNKGSLEGLRSAEEAFQTALRLNPDSAMTHNLYTHLQVDQGKTLDALKRLLGRAVQRRTDAELFAGLGHICRYCGLLNASLAAHAEARRVDPLISTSVMHTHFMKGDYQKSLETAEGDYGYGMALALASLGRVDEAIAALRERETSKPWKLGRLYLSSLRTLLEGKREESLKASEELMQATFRDPEGMFYLARQLSYLAAQDAALEMLSRAVKNGFFCYPALVRDPWLDELRTRAEFTSLLRGAQQSHREASATFLASGGDALLGIVAESY
ncbi:MAG TPA: protein kinase [Candidatus Methylomirabilis sp.]|nr:protein kinase [Candidatus Methylomirabilis sp.]